jgi:hypothetical protein
VRVGCAALDGGRTRVTLVHDGWGEGGEWDEGFKYFGVAWQLVLGRLFYRFAHGPLDWANPYTPTIAGGGGITANARGELEGSLD